MATTIFTPNTVITSFTKPKKEVFNINLRKESAYFGEYNVIDTDFKQAITLRFYYYGKYKTAAALWVYNEPIATNIAESNSLVELLRKAGYTIALNEMRDAELLKTFAGTLGIKIGCIIDSHS